MKTPIGYPGGKSLLVKQIYAMLPEDFALRDYREPFVGGAPVFYYLHSQFHGKGRGHIKGQGWWINDANPSVAVFWTQVRDNSEALAARARAARAAHTAETGRGFWNEVVNMKAETPFDQAYRFYLLNRMSWGYIGDTYNTQSFDENGHSRFTFSAINRLEAATDALQFVNITNLDYADVVNERDEDAFIFLDPPYSNVKQTTSLYVRMGGDKVLHETFDHDRLAETLRNAPQRHRWLMTINDAPEIHELYKGFRIIPYTARLSMNNFNRTSSKRRGELFILNY